MTAAQIVTPTSSALAMVNAMQAAVVSSVNWTVNATGTTAAGFKWVEVKPASATSLYKDFRVLILEKATYSSGRGLTNGAWNSASYVYVHFCPDGGSSWTTFTPANIESAASVYVGSKYKSAADTPIWNTIPSSWSATWLYECDGALWFINRSTATSHAAFGFGHILGISKTGKTNYNEEGTEVGLPGFYIKAGITSTNALPWWNFLASPAYGVWYHNANGTKTLHIKGEYATHSGTTYSAAQTDSAHAFSIYDATNGEVIFTPITFYSSDNNNISANTSHHIFRGMSWITNVTTRSVLRTGTPSEVCGYTFHTDDFVSSGVKQALAFFNTP